MEKNKNNKSSIYVVRNIQKMDRWTDRQTAMDGWIDVEEMVEKIQK